MNPKKAEEILIFLAIATSLIAAVAPAEIWWSYAWHGGLESMNLGLPKTIFLCIPVFLIWIIPTVVFHVKNKKILLGTMVLSIIINISCLYLFFTGFFK